MRGISDTLDLEFEDPIQISPPLFKNKKKVIGLDDLLVDHYKEQNRLLEKESRRKKFKKIHYSDEDEDDYATEAKFSECVDRCQNQMGQMGGDDEMPLWGLQVFGDQKLPQHILSPELSSCTLLQSFITNDLNSLVGLQLEKGECFLEGLLSNGWLLKLVQTRRKLDKSLATWTFNLMLYSPSVVLSSAANNFWDALLSDKNEADPLQIEWMPSYSELGRALELYGFQSDSSFTSLSNSEMVHADSDKVGPPQNIRCWINFISVCCRARNTHLIFSISEVEDVLFKISSLFLDRRLVCLLGILNECLVSVISFFTDDEWRTSSEIVAKSLACRLPKDINCLRIVESISAVDQRHKHLRSTIAFQFLVASLENQANDPEEILKLLMSMNVRDKNFDLLKMYIYIGLAENWLLCSSILKDKPVLNEMWTICLRNCSCQITSSDLRAYALKLRSKALYLLQSITSK